MKQRNDLIRVHTVFMGSINVFLRGTNLDWPPPEFITFADGELREATKDDPRNELFYRVNMSEITDEQAKAMSNVARGAEYKYVEEEAHVDRSTGSLSNA